MSSVVFYSSPPYSLRQILSLDLEFTDPARPGWPASSRDPLYLPSQPWDYKGTQVCPDLPRGCWGLNADLHTCVASTWPNEPPVQA